MLLGLEILIILLASLLGGLLTDLFITAVNTPRRRPMTEERAKELMKDYRGKWINYEPSYRAA